MKKLYYLFSLLLIFSFLEKAIAQEDILRPNGRKIIGKYSDDKPRVKEKAKRFILGLEAGANLNFYSQDLIWERFDFVYDLPTIYDTYKSGFGVSSHFGIFGEFPYNDKLGITARINWDNRNFGGSGTGYAYSLITEGLKAPMQLDWEVQTTWLSVNLGVNYKLNNNWFLSGSLIVESMTDDGKVDLTPSSTDNTSLGNIGFYPYVGSTNTKETISTPIESAAKVSTRLGIEIGAGYKYPITNSVYLVPQARFQWFLNPIFNDQKIQFVDVGQTFHLFDVSHLNRNLNTLQLALGLWFDL